MDYKLSSMGVLFCLTATCPQIGLAANKESNKAKRPNFVWFMAEDVAKHHLSMYNADGRGAATPNAERLAREGIIFEHAFCNAPVSSAARSTLFTGMYAPRVALSWHRTLEQIPLPEGAQMFPAYLTEAGYYTANSMKTDYNCVMPEGTWNEPKAQAGTWKDRPDKSVPFFYVQTTTKSHESSLHFPLESMKKVKTRHNPKEVKVAPFHPNTELFRYTYATFYDRISETDAELGRLVSVLEDEGELDDTFIFYFGDNGGATPFTKGYTGEQGLHVPLVVYVPKNWRDKIQLPVDYRAKGFVSFLDFGPTLLHLAGIEVPEHMDGTPFLGKDISRQESESRDVAYGYGDRFDELYAFNRTVRKGKYKYSRNFVPYQPKGFFAFYRYKMEAFKEWEALRAKDKLTEVQKAFFEPQFPEELYDISVDPYETNNLVNHPAYADVLRDLRGMLKQHMKEVNDLGVIPESVWLAEGKESIVEYGEKNKEKIARYIDMLDWEMFPFDMIERHLKKSLQSDDPVEVFWATTMCVYYGTRSHTLHNEIVPLLNHESPIIKSRALVVLTILTGITPGPLMKEILQESRSGAESLIILGDMAYLKEYITGAVFDIKAEDVPFPAGSYEWRVNFIMN